MKLNIVCEGRNAARLSRPAIEGSARRLRHTIICGRCEEALPTIPAARHYGKPSAQARTDARRAFRLPAIIDQYLTGDAVQCHDPGAFQFYRSRKRPCTEGPRSPAPRDADLRKTLRRKRAERNIAEKGIAHGHTVEQDERPTGRIAAQSTQCRALGGRIRGTTVRTAELLEPRNRRKSILDPPRRHGKQLVAIDFLRVVSWSSRCRFQPRAGHNDYRLIGLRECGGRGGDRDQAGSQRISKNDHRARPNARPRELRVPARRLH